MKKTKKSDVFPKKTLKKLKRRDLIVLMLDQAKQIDMLNASVEELKAKHAEELASVKVFYDERLKAASDSAEERVNSLKEQLSFQRNADTGKEALETATRMYKAIKNLFFPIEESKSISSPKSVLIQRKRHE